MPLKTKVGQIFLTHRKDENYTSLYEETLKKHGKIVELFAVIEIADGAKTPSAGLAREYRKIEQDIVSAFKKVYVSTDLINEAAFERALATVNLALARLAGKSKVRWFGKTNVLLAAVYDSVLSLSATGNAQAYLNRGGETNQVTENQIEQKLNPVKIFSTFTSGKLAPGDRVILSTNQLFNYLSMQRIEGFLSVDRLKDLCEDIIEALQDIKNIGFATFIFEVLDSGSARVQEPAEDAPVLSATPRPIAFEKIASQKTLYFIFQTLALGLKRLFLLIWIIAKKLAGVFYRGGKNFSLSQSLQKPKPLRKKAIQLAITGALAVLVIAVAVAAWNKSATNNRAGIDAQIAAAEERLNEAEARLIFEDGDRAVELVREAEESILALEKKAGDDERLQRLVERLTGIKQKIDKKVAVENPTVLAEFPNIPSELLRSENGMLGFNKNSGSLAFYDFRTGQTQTLLSGQNTGNLILGEYVGGGQDYVFLNRDGQFKKLSVAEDSLANFQDESSLDLLERKIRSFAVFGAGNEARIYLLDSNKSEILRLGVQSGGIGPSEQWLADEANLRDSLDFAVDGNIFVLFSNRLEKYFRGERADFELAEVLPELAEASKIYTSAEAEFIYILDPANERILAFNKSGRLINQYISDKFRDLTDIYPDENLGVAYVLAGAELLQIELK